MRSLSISPVGNRVKILPYYHFDLLILFQVGIGMALRHLDLDVRHSILTVDSWMRFHWIDESLKWDPDDHGSKTMFCYFFWHNLMFDSGGQSWNVRPTK